MDTCVGCHRPTTSGLALLGGDDDIIAGLQALGVGEEAHRMVPRGRQRAGDDVAVGVLACQACANQAGLDVAEVTEAGISGVPHYWLVASAAKGEGKK